MIEIASLIKRVVVDMQDSHTVAKDVIDFRKQFQRVQYAFDNAVGAYEYINLVGDRKQQIYPHVRPANGERSLVLYSQDIAGIDIPW